MSSSAAELHPPATLDPRPLATPVVFIIFNRPDCAAESLARIRAVRPRKLYVVADGPRPERAGEADLVRATRELVEAGIDWPCELVREYADVNLGCARRVSTGLDRVFAREEQAIVVEDDCLTEPSFYRYCEELLEYYRNESRIFVISGTNQQYRPFACAHSYFFSRYNHCWGWATWARAWRHFDFCMRAWPEFRHSPQFSALFEDRHVEANWRDILDQVAAGRVDSWGYRWVFACWSHSALSILPCRPLVKNIGFDERATHTRRATRELRDLQTQPMAFPLRHPDRIERDSDADRHTESRMYRPPSLLRRWLTPLVRVVRRPPK